MLSFIRIQWCYGSQFPKITIILAFLYFFIFAENGGSLRISLIWMRPSIKWTNKLSLSDCLRSWKVFKSPFFANIARLYSLESLEFKASSTFLIYKSKSSAHLRFVVSGSLILSSVISFGWRFTAVFSKVPQLISFTCENVFKDLSVCKVIYFAGIFKNQPKYSKYDSRLISKCPQWGYKKIWINHWIA